MAFRGDHAFQGNSKRVECTEIRVQVQSSTFWSQTNKCFFFFIDVLSRPWALNNVSDCLPCCSFIKQQLVFIYFNSPELFTDCETDVFVHFYSSLWLSLNNISLSLWIWLLYPLKREGWQRGSSYGCEINKTCHLYEQRWALRLFAALVWPVSLSSALNGSLCDRRAGWGRTWESHNKGDCCGFREADGAVHQMGVWGSNKPVDLEAGTRVVNTASSGI